jgi:hypothetical protein
MMVLLDMYVTTAQFSGWSNKMAMKLTETLSLAEQYNKETGEKNFLIEGLHKVFYTDEYVWWLEKKLEETK